MHRYINNNILFCAPCHAAAADATYNFDEFNKRFIYSQIEIL